MTAACKKVLLTGATGYVGRRLAHELMKRDDVRLRLLVRNAAKLGPGLTEGVEIAEGDTLKKQTLAEALHGVDCAYYLVHSMGAGSGDYAALDRRGAENFREACVEAGVKRIIYLGGLGVPETASKHLRSRIETGELLGAGAPQLVWIRAGIIIGSGGASFEIVRNLVEKLPLMLAPRWVSTKTQPVAIDDVIAYLVQALYLSVNESLMVDIGSRVMSFREMLERTAVVMGLRRRLITVPLFSPRLSSYWLVLFTPVPFRMAAALVEGLKSETVCLNDNAEKFFPGIVPASFEDAMSRALAETERQQVLSRWCDSSGGEVCDLAPGGPPDGAVYRLEETLPVRGIPADRLFKTMMSMGGRRGWLSFQALWALRGLVDKLAGGYGLNRGRRLNNELRVGDALDFWKVADIKQNRRLLLLSQMKLPGRGWLEFTVGEGLLGVTVHFIPRGLAGRAYWYALYPAHWIIFKVLAGRLLRAARQETPRGAADTV